MDEPFNALISTAAGVALAAACGFRVFIPLLVVSIAARSGALGLSEGFAWIGSTPALVALAVATALEIGAYYVPWVDNALDLVATPAAIVAGIVVSAAVITGMDPWLKWTLATVAGGAAAAAVQVPTVIVRGASSATTGGAANPLVATGEAAAATTLSIGTVLWPAVMILAAVALGWWLWSRARRRRESPALA